jgi:DNA relaxase NicK
MRAKIIIDYLTLTVHGAKSDPHKVITSILGMDIAQFEHSNKGINFYQQSLHYNNIRVLYDGIHGNKMGICVTMSGKGCRAYEEYHGNSIMSLMDKIARNPDINITRIDIACDDKVGLLDLSKIWQYASDGNYRTRLLKRHTHESFDGKSEGAKTLYFGSRSSQYYIRIYDKAKQSKFEGENTDKNTDQNAGQGLRHSQGLSPATDESAKADMDNKLPHWVRLEISLKSDYAMQAVGFLVLSKSMNKTIGEVVSGIINAKFAFIEPDNENISRCSVADWWADFLGDIHEVEFLSKQKYSHEIDQHKKWLRESCGRVIAKVFYAVGEERFFDEILAYGNLKLSVSDIAQIRAYQQREERKEEWRG